jgi:hypothetical protein
MTRVINAIPWLVLAMLIVCIVLWYFHTLGVIDSTYCVGQPGWVHPTDQPLLRCGWYPHL